MHWIIRFILLYRNINALVLTALLSLLMIGSSPGRQREIARTLSYSFFYPFQFCVNQTTRVKNIFAENRKLKEQAARQSVTIAQLREEAAQSEEMEDMLGLQQDLNFDMVAARVVVQDPSFICRSAVIDVGKDSGVTTYMPVVTGDGVVGKIVQVMGHMALVQLLPDPSNRTAVLVDRSREAGILETENGNDFFIRCPVHADVNAGDTVVSSGLGGVYPKGLAVGIVTGIRESRDPLFKKAFVKLGVDFNRLEEVFVLRIQSQWASFHDEVDTLEHPR